MAILWLPKHYFVCAASSTSQNPLLTCAVWFQISRMPKMLNSGFQNRSNSSCSHVLSRTGSPSICICSSFDFFFDLFIFEHINTFWKTFVYPVISFTRFPLTPGDNMTMERKHSVIPLIKYQNTCLCKVSLINTFSIWMVTEACCTCWNPLLSAAWLYKEMHDALWIILYAQSESNPSN